MSSAGVFVTSEVISGQGHRPISVIQGIWTIVIMQSQIRRALKRLVSALNLDPRISFHAFCRSGASLAFASGVPFWAIQAHVTCAPDALWAYIDVDACDCSVPRFFASVFANF
jgi:hypothetical protein